MNFCYLPVSFFFLPFLRLMLSSVSHDRLLPLPQRKMGTDGGRPEKNIYVFCVLFTFYSFFSLFTLFFTGGLIVGYLLCLLSLRILLLQIRQEKPYYQANPELDSLVSNCNACLCLP